MKANFKNTLLVTALTLFTMISNTACTKSSSDDGGGGGAAQSTLALQSATVASGATINLIPTGGVTPYQFTIQSTIGGTLTSYQTYATFQAGNTAGLVGVTVTDAAGATVQASITVTSAAGGMVVSPMTFTVAPGGTVSYSVTGGTAPYTYVASAGTFTGATFTAPSTAQTVTVTISDSNVPARTVTATVTVSSGTTTANGCGGTYSLNLSGYPGTLFIVQNTAGQISGYLTLTGYGGPAAISGTCNNTNGTINFTDLYSNDPYTGQFFPNPYTGKIFMMGTFTDNGSTYQWSASQQ